MIRKSIINKTFKESEGTGESFVGLFLRRQPLNLMLRTKFKLNVGINVSLTL